MPRVRQLRMCGKTWKLRLGQADPLQNEQGGAAQPHAADAQHPTTRAEIELAALGAVRERGQGPPAASTRRTPVPGVPVFSIETRLVLY